MFLNFFWSLLRTTKVLSLYAFASEFFTFADEILTQNSDFYIAGLNVDALFTNIPLDETIHICVKKLFHNSCIIIQ